MKRWPMIALLIVQLLSGVVFSPLRSFLPIYLNEQLAYSAAAASVWIALGQVVGMAASMLGGALCDNLGHKQTLALGLVGFVLSSLLYLSPLPGWVMILWMLGSAGMALITLGGQSYLIDVAPPARLGMLSAFYNWGFTLGGALIGPLAGWLLDFWNYGIFGGALAGFSALGCAFALGMPASRGDLTGVRPSLLRMSGGYRDALRQPRVIVLGLLRFLPTCYWGMVMTLMPLLIKRSAGDNTAVGLYSTVSLIAAALTQLFVGRAADRWGRRIPTLAMLAGVVTAALGLALSAPRLWGLYGFGILGACSAWSLSTLMPSLVADAIVPIERSRALGFVHLAWNAGMILGSLLGGALLDMAVGLPFFIVALLNGGAWLLAYRFFGRFQMRETRNVKCDHRQG